MAALVPVSGNIQNISPVGSDCCSQMVTLRTGNIHYEFRHISGNLCYPGGEAAYRHECNGILRCKPAGSFNLPATIPSSYHWKKESE